MPETDGLNSYIDGLIRRHETVGLAVGMVGPEGMRLFRGYGVADRRTGVAITEDTGFRIASVTKTFTAVAVMQLVERGSVELDAPANDYLHQLRLVPARADHRPASVRHLLTHTAGLGELAHLSGLIRPDFGESVLAGEPLPTVADFYGGAIRLKSEPGTGFTYGNHSPTVLGQLVEDVTGEPLAGVFRESIFGPLGMADSDLERGQAVRARLATGHEPKGDGWRVVEERDMVTAGAASVYSTPSDMARYAAALLGGGANEHGRILAPETLAQMFAPQYRPDARIPGMGLGFFRTEVGGHRVAEHQGVHPGFYSHLAVAPDAGIGVIVFTNGARDPMFWLSNEADDLLGAAMEVPAEDGRGALPLRPEAAAELVGWYRLAGPWSDLRKRLFMGAGAEVFERGGAPRMRFLSPVPDLYRGFALKPDDPDDPDVFRVDLDEAGTSRVVFRRTDDGCVASLVLGMMPIELQRQPRHTNPRLWIDGLLATLVLVAASLVLGRVLRRR